MKKFDKIHEKIKFKAFGKTTLRNTKIEVKKSNFNEEVKKDDAKVLFQEEVKRTEKEINETKKIKSSKVGRIWEIRKRIIVGKKATLEATAVVDPKNGKLAVSKHQIRTVTLQYCKETLANNKPSKGYEGVMQDKKDNLTMKLLECN